jgi:hypothetical protein
MTSSGRKRGLAVAATTALALSGLAFTTSAQADTIQENEDAVVQLYTPLSGDPISIRPDGENTTVTVAAGSNSLATNSFSFYYDSNATPGDGEDTLIADVPNLNGWGTVEWTPPVGAALAAIDNVVVKAFDNADVQVGATQVAAIANPAGTPTNQSTSLAGTDRDALGRYPIDNSVILSGFTTNMPGTFVRVGGPNTPGSGFIFADPTGPTTATGTPFGAVVPVGVNDTADPIDEIVAQAGLGGATGSNVAQVYSMYDQVLQPVTKATEPGFGANVAGFPAGEEAHWILSAVDQNGNPVGGVDIYESNAVGDDLPSADGMGRTLGNGNFNDDETDALGQVTVRLNEDGGTYGIDGTEDQNPAPGIGTTYVVVDKDEDGFFDNGSDQIIQLDITNIPQAPATIEVVSSLGNVMDDDESTNITAIVKDANGDTIQDATVNLTESKDVADDSPADSLTNLGNDDSDPDGVADWPGTQTPGENNNAVSTTYTATSGAAVGTLTIETDQALALWDSGVSQQALATTDMTPTGHLELPSGSPLPNRHVELNYTPSDNSLFAPQVEQPAGTIRGGDFIADATTDASGLFSVKIDDPALPNGEELDSVLNAATTSFSSASQNLDVDFIRSLTPTRVEILNGPGGVNSTPGTPTTADGLEPLLTQDGGTPNPGDDALIPGGLALGQVRVFNSDDTPLDDVTVNLTINEGNFVDIFDPFEPTPAIGAPVDFASLGQNVTVSTGDLLSAAIGLDEGSALIVANIERNAGFDDDGLVEDELIATAGAASDEHDATWTTNTVPINPRATDPLVVELSADQESSILPKARAGDILGAGQEVDYDVSTWDQFGNPTRQNIDVDDSNPISGFTGGATSDFDLFQPAISANSAAATNQSLEVELEGPVTFTYFDDINDSEFDPANPLDNIQQLPVVVEENTAAINWYDVNYGASTFSLIQQGPNTVPVGTAVTEVLSATDQEGQPIENLVVDFLRGGPGNEDDDSCNEDLLNNCQVTDGNGEAFYDFVGGSIGTATISAVVYEPIVDGAARIDTIGPDTVRFGSLATINVKLTGKNASNNRDRLKVDAPSIAAQATVRLQKKVNGVWKKVGPTETLNAFGNKVFKVKDKNGNKVTKYRAKVSPTTTTKKDTSNKVKQK